MEAIVKVREVAGVLVVTVPKRVATAAQMVAGDYVRVIAHQLGVVVDRIDERIDESEPESAVPVSARNVRRGRKR